MPSPVAMIFTSVSGADAKLTNARNRIKAALVTSRPVRASPSTRASLVDRPPSNSARASEDEDLVVHRESE